MARDLLLTSRMTTNIQTLSLPPVTAIYAHEASQLSAIALALVGFVERVQLGPDSAAQRRDLKASASKMRLHVSIAGSAPSARRRRTWYERAQERVATFAFALLDLRQSAQIAPEDFAVGRALAARGKTLLDAQLAALDSMALEEQEDVGKLDELLLTADSAACLSLDGAGSPTTAAAARAPAAIAPAARQGGAVDSTPAPNGGGIGNNGGPPPTNRTAPQRS